MVVEATAYQTFTPQSFSTPDVSGFVQYAGFWIRFVAFFIDYFLSYFLMVVVAFSIGIMMGLSGYDASSIEFIGFIVGMITPWLYWSIMESSSKQATLGKMVLGIIVTDYQGNRISFGQATARYWAKILSALILCIGFFMAGFTAKKQGLHDIMAESLVVKKQTTHPQYNSDTLSTSSEASRAPFY